MGAAGAAVGRDVRPGHLRDVVASQLAAILENELGRDAPADRLVAIFDLLTKTSLDRPAMPPFTGLSAINADGLPFQFVFRFGATQSGFGFLCESGRPGAPPRARMAESLGLVASACELACGSQCQALETLAAIVLPGDDEPWPQHWRSAIWTGVATARGSIVVKPYFNLNRGNCRERWLRAGKVLQALGRQHSLQTLCDISGPCSNESWPVGLALDIGPGGRLGRVKIYFRSGPVDAGWLARWYDAAGQHDAYVAVRRALDLLGPTGRFFPAGGMVLSFECHADEGISLKTDFAVTKWPNNDRSIIEATRSLAAALAIHPRAIGEAFHAIHPADADRTETTACRFVGLGTEPDGSSHLNLYMEPPLSPHGAAKPSAGRTTLAMAIKRGADALFSKQRKAHWQDFNLPVGPSDAWVTAYVLAALAPLRQNISPLLADAALDWLQAARTPHAGWGYNDDVPCDADSTAWALIAFNAWNRAVPRAATDFLLTCGSVAGGFATYPADATPKPGWSRPAPDVTVMARRALGAPPVDIRADAALRRAYWWASPLYVTAMALEGGARATPALMESVSTFEPSGAFERALLLLCFTHIGYPARHLVDCLLSDQLPDGSWRGSALLRLTDDNIEEPHAVIDSGPLFVDDRGLFTTATVLNALARHRLPAAPRIARSPSTVASMAAIGPVKPA